MRKTCVQLVGGRLVTSVQTSKLSTLPAVSLNPRWIKLELSPTLLHNFSVQFSPSLYGQITEVSGEFSPLSTPPIIRANQVKKEKLLIEQRG